MSTSNLNSGGIDFIGLLTILFIGLKLTNHIDWSWLWVSLMDFRTYCIYYFSNYGNSIRYK
jgi:hypothetical protein